MKIEQTECSETLAYKIQTPGNHPKENIQLINYIAQAGSVVYSIHYLLDHSPWG